MEITLTATALLALMLIFHSGRISLVRGKYGINLGDGDNDELLRRIRIQGNFVEYVPLLLLVMAGLESSGVSSWWVWIYADAIILGRILHAYGMWTPQTPMWARVGGMVLTYIPLLVGAVILLFHHLGSGLGLIV
jgi:uncharacterized membrane protein YecN with MAPEG domain